MSSYASNKRHVSRSHRSYSSSSEEIQLSHHQDISSTGSFLPLTISKDVPVCVEEVVVDSTTKFEEVITQDQDNEMQQDEDQPEEDYDNKPMGELRLSVAQYIVVMCNTIAICSLSAVLFNVAILVLYCLLLLS